MKKNHGLILLLSAGITTLSLNSCSKAVVSSSPADPEAGAPATQTISTAGNVFVDQINLTNASWITDPNSSRHYDYYFNQITPDIINTGKVLVFFTPGGVNSNQWVSMPTSLDAGSGYAANYSFETTNGKATFHFTLAPTRPDAQVPSVDSYTIPGSQFKVIAITQQVLNSTQTCIDWSCYDQVSRLLNL